MAGLVAVAVAWFALSLFQPFKGDGGDPVRVTVPRGSSLEQIAKLLEQNEVVSSSTFFQLRARLAGRSDGLKPGRYTLRKDMSFTAALDELEKGTSPNIVVLTIPEGLSRGETAKITKGRLPGSYVAATRRSRLLDPRDYRAKGATSLEGFLFPATYELRRGQSVRRLVDRQLSTFKERFRTVSLRKARSKNLTPWDVLIIASMVEREAQIPSERRLIASVIYNRLREGIPLGIDATLRFETGNWDRPLRVSQLQAATPYNTRVNLGLAARPDRQPGAGLHPGGGRSRAHQVPLLRGEAVRRGPARLRGHRRRAPAQRGGLRPGPREEQRQLARRLLMPLAGVLGHPVGHSRSPAMMNAAFARARPRLALREAAGAPRPLRRHGEGTARLRLPRRQRDHPAQGGRPGAGRRGERRRGRHRRGQHAHVRERRASGRTTPTPAA